MVPHTGDVTVAAPHEEFACRLHQALDSARFTEGRSRAAALAMQYAVSRETTRKWLSGLALPELPRMIELATDMGCSFEWLATGRGQMTLYATPTPPRAAVGESPAAAYQVSGEELSMLSVFRTLPPHKRKLLLQFLSE